MYGLGFTFLLWPYTQVVNFLNQKTGKTMLSYRSILVILVVLFLTACSGSPYQYHVEPTTLEKGKTQYMLGDVTVNLILGHGGKPNDERFASEEALTQSFKQFLISHLNDRKILASDAASAELNVSIDYERRFNYGGNALNKPHVSFTAKVTQNGQLLASFGEYGFTTKYSGFKDMAVNAQITAFTWGPEDEPKDIALISKTIIDDVYNLGK